MLAYNNLPSGVAGKNVFKDEYDGEDEPDFDEDNIARRDQLPRNILFQKANMKRTKMTPAVAECFPERPWRTLSQMVAEAKARIDPFTKNIINESAKVLKKNWLQGTNSDGYLLAPQPSLSRIIKNSPSGTLGIDALNFSPMRLRRVYGRTGTIPVFNLTGIHKSHVVYAASNVIVVFDYYENRQSILQGHKNKVTCLAKDLECKYFASGDVGKDSSIIIWDISTGLPHKTFPASNSGLGIISVGFLGNQEYIGTIGLEQIIEEQVETETVEQEPEIKPEVNPCEGIVLDPAAEAKRKAEVEEKRKAKEIEKEKAHERKFEELQVVSIWNFALHHQNRHERAGGHPEVVVIIPKKAGHQHEIVFDDDNPDYFVTTGKLQVVFYTWMRKLKTINYHLPRVPKKFIERMKGFTVSIWMRTNKENWCLTGTGAGCIVAWATMVPLGLREPPNPNLNIKQYKRSYKIGENAITALTPLGDYFVVGDDTGIVKFFDNKFRIVRWTKNFNLPPITSVGFNYGDTMPLFKEEMQNNYDEKLKPHAHREKISAVRDYTFGGEKYRQPSQTTIERPPFYAPDFVIGCEDGSIYYYHLAEARVDPLIYGTPGPIVALDCCPKTTHVAMCTLHGDLQMYDYMGQNLIFNGKVLKKKKLKEEVSCLKFHPNGSFALLGMRSGLLFFRHSYTWKAMEQPLDNASGAIERIIFSDDGLFMSHSDATNAVAMYAFNVQRKNWVFRGHHRSHYRPIVEILFTFDEPTKANRLFSLGQDRCLIEYNIPDSNSMEGLLIQNIFYAEQSSIPTAMTIDISFPELGPMILHANADNKIKVYDQYANKFRRCCQGPNYGAPVNRMISVTPDYTNGRRTKFILIVMGNKIGLMKTPVDGNPFKSMAVLAHPEGVLELAVACNQKEVFTCGLQDNCCFMWAPNVEVLETTALAGGSGVGPYRQLLDAELPPGKSIFDDVENIFYHLMLRSAMAQDEMFRMNLEIPIFEIPIVMRTCGFYPSEQEIDLMMEEAEFLIELRTKEKPTTIGFEDFIQLFANHRPVPNFPPDEVYKAFEILGELNEQDEVFIDRDHFETYLTKYGEILSLEDLPHLIPQLYRVKEKSFEAEEPKPWLLHYASSQIPGLTPSSYGDSDDASSPHPTLSRRATQGKLSIIGSPEEGSDDKNSDDDNGKVEVKPSATSVESGSTMSSEHSDSLELESPTEEMSGIDFHPESPEPDLDNYVPPEDELEGEDQGGQPFGYWSFKARPEEIELPEEITAKFFIEQMLPEEAQDTIGSNFQKEFEERKLAEIYAQDECKIWDDIVKRWKGRDQWRYFKCVFEKLAEKGFPIGQKLKLALEMDNFCRTGKWPDLRDLGEDEIEEEAEMEAGTGAEAETEAEEEVMPVEPVEEFYYKSPDKSDTELEGEMLTTDFAPATLEQLEPSVLSFLADPQIEFNFNEYPPEEEDGEGQGEGQFQTEQGNDETMGESDHSAGSDDSLTGEPKIPGWLGPFARQKTGEDDTEEGDTDTEDMSDIPMMTTELETEDEEEEFPKTEPKDSDQDLV